MIEKVRRINDIFIKMNDENKEERKKYELIGEILKKDDCFLNMDIETAYSILRDLDIEEEYIKNIYSALIEE